jgi:uncharacterized protein YkwD
MLDQLLARVRDRRLLEKVAWTFGQALLASPALDSAAGPSDVLLVAVISAVATGLLALLDWPDLPYWGEVALRAARTFVATFAGALTASTVVFNASALHSAGFAALAAALAVVKGAAAQYVGDPNDPATLPAEPVETAGVQGDEEAPTVGGVAAASLSQGFWRRRARRLRGRRRRRARARRQPSGGGSAGGVRAEVLELTNQQRARLQWNDDLANAAQAHAVDQERNNFMGHNSSDGTPWFKRVEHWFGTDYGRIAENTARGFSSPNSVMVAWMNSPEHRANILDGSLRLMGVGQSSGSWTQDFARR